MSTRAIFFVLTCSSLSAAHWMRDKYLLLYISLPLIQTGIIVSFVSCNEKTMEPHIATSAGARHCWMHHSLSTTPMSAEMIHERGSKITERKKRWKKGRMDLYYYIVQLQTLNYRLRCHLKDFTVYTKCIYSNRKHPSQPEHSLVINSETGLKSRFLTKFRSKRPRHLVVTSAYSLVFIHSHNIILKWEWLVRLVLF